MMKMVLDYWNIFEKILIRSFFEEGPLDEVQKKSSNEINLDRTGE